MKADRAKTVAQQYLHPKSFMRADGSEVLKNEDWIARKRELWDRCGGRCEYTERITTGILRCNREGQIPAHVIPRYPWRDDRLSNLRCYCLEHDRLTEAQSWRKTRFGEKAAAGPERCKKCGELAYCLKGLCDKCAPLAAGRP